MVKAPGTPRTSGSAPERAQVANSGPPCGQPLGIVPGRDEHLPEAPDVAIRSFRRAIESGRHWYPAILQAIGLWDHPTERRSGEWHTYLIQDEALDCLLLAERLAAEVWDLVPHQEVVELLFNGTPPVPLGEEEVRELLGPWKYRAYLNFFYGVTVEEALIFATEQEIRRESPVGVYVEGQHDDAYERIYGATQRELVAEFRGEAPSSAWISIDYAEWKAFVYWLFKRRLEHCLPPRVASDTKKALAELRRQYAATGRSVYRLWVDPPATAPKP